MRRQHRPGSARLAHLWEFLGTSFWFVPALMTAGGVGLSIAFIRLDELVKARWVRSVGDRRRRQARPPHGGTVPLCCGHADQVARDAREALVNERDRHEVEERYAAALQALAAGG